MRKLVWLMIAVLAAACGSGSDITRVKAARYKGDKDQLFAAMKAAVEAKYPIHEADAATLTVKTEAHWWEPDGTSAHARDDDMRSVANRSIQIIEVVSLLPSDGAWIVAIHPLYQRYIAGRPNTDVLREDDPSLPGFAFDKVDSLAADVHDALRQWEVGSVPAQPGVASPSPGISPPPPPPPTAAPEPPLGY